ncbi:MAG: hypothetical protein EA384_10425 [Spirochaetaceae bacterium]|nr:MAG: hypothetical protein EA384_10425 [Spirochaetaceae bacterium]
MNDGILRVKISIPPLATGILPRPRLHQALELDLRGDNAFLRRLTLASAPAGYGKTTQVRAWLCGREASLAWYSLDDDDDDPGRYWTHLIAALQAAAPGIGSASAEALRSNEPSPDRSSGAGSQLVPLLNDLFALERPVYLVLDDYHHVEHTGIHQDMVFFLENLPPSVHVIVTTRSDPPWPLSRWRARNTIREIRLEELRFTEEEVARLCADRTGLPLAETHLAILTEKTEGWIAGLQLAMHSLLSHREDMERFIREFDGSHRHVLYFLSEEILLRQSPHMQDFLLRTALLQRFCAPLCDAVTGRDDSEQLIAELVRENLFIIRLDEQGTWFRYHALFADLLQYRLIRMDPDAIPELHRRASRWFLSRKLPGEAVRHALMAQDMAAVVRILEEHHDGILVSEGPGQLIRCLEDLPDEILLSSPILVLFKALYFLNYFGREQAEPYLRLAEDLVCETDEAQQRFCAMRSTVLSFYHIYSQRHDLAIEQAEQALRALPREEYTWRMRVAIYSGDARLFSGNPLEAYPFYEEAHRNALKGTNRFLPLTTALKTATALYHLGRLKEAWELTREMLATARREGLARIPRVGLLWGLLGELNREYGNLDEAERCLERALIMGEQEKPAWGWNSLYRAALYHSRGEPHHVLATVQQIETLNTELKLPAFVTTGAAVWKARALVSLGEDEKARRQLLALHVAEGEVLPEGLERAGLVLARIMMARAADDGPGTNKTAARGAEPDAPSAAVHELLDLVEQRAHSGGDLRLLVEARLLKARIAKTLGKHAQAQQYLEAARAAGRPAGFNQLFVDEGDAAAAEAAEGGTLPPVRSSCAGLVEELSQRETEILQLVGEGLSNDAIGEKLFISPGTVKWHLSNVFGKLGVSKRTRAIAVARQMGLLS